MFNDALYLLHERGKAMQDAVPVGEGSMLAILGLNIEDINKIINDFEDEGICEVANDNAIGQVIVSGNKNSLDNLTKNLKQKNKIDTVKGKCTFPLFLDETSV